MSATVAAQRLSVLTNHLMASSASDGAAAAAAATTTMADAAGALAAHADDVVIVRSVRTALCKAKRGLFKDTPIDNLLAPVLQDLIQKTGIDPKLVGDVVIGNVLGPGAQVATQVRIAMLLAGLAVETPCTTVNRQCSSGLQAIANVAAAIKAGYYEVGIAGGVESMSTHPMSWDGELNQAALAHPTAQGCYVSMGLTSENVAERYQISRETQDKFAVASHQKAAAAIKAGRFTDEIVPVKTRVQDAKTEEWKDVTVTADEGVREDTTVDGLAKLKPAFKPDGSTTAGNASQMTDGAAAALLMRRSTADRLRLPIVAVFRAYAVVGVEPAIMGVGPAVAIPAAVKSAGLQLADIDVYEINEAFASQASYCVDHLRLPAAKVNPNGGGISLGHPLGCTGARQTATLLQELKRNGKRFGVVSMCIGSGMGAAAVFERV